MVKPFRVVVLDQVFSDTAVEQAIIERAGGHLEIPDGDRDAVLRAAKTADALLTTDFCLGRAEIDQLDRCRVIARYGIGVDKIDLDAAAAHGIIVTNTDYCVEEVAAHTVAMMLALVRRLPGAHQAVVSGQWASWEFAPMLRPSRMTLGLVGYGRIARRVARIAEGLSMHVVVHDPYLPAGVVGCELVPLNTLLRCSDIVSLHCPLTAASHGLIGVDELALMRPHAILINTARGALVALDELVKALREGRLGGAGLDVFDAEPADPQRFEGVPNLLLSPHMAYYSDEAVVDAQRKAATQVVKVMAGTPVDFPVRSFS